MKYDDVEQGAMQLQEVNGDLDLRVLIGRLWLGKLWVIAVTLLCTGLAAVHAFTTSPIYRSELVLTVRSDSPANQMAALRSQFGGLASIAGINLGNAGTQRQEWIALLNSRALAREFIVSHDLMPVLFAGRWDSEAQAFRKNSRDATPTIGDAVDRLMDTRQINEDIRTGLITVAFEWVDRQLASDWANGYIELANEMLRQEAIEESKQSIAYLEEELRRTNLEPVRSSLYSLMEGRLNETMLATIQPQYAFKVIDRAQPSEPGKFVRPRRAILIFLGVVLGLAIGSVFALWRHRSIDPKPST